MTSSPSSTTVQLASRLGFLVGLLLSGGMVASSYLVAVEDGGCKDLHRAEKAELLWPPLDCVLNVFVFFAALHQLVSDISPSVPIQLLTVVQIQFVIGIGIGIGGSIGASSVALVLSALGKEEWTLWGVGGLVVALICFFFNLRKNWEATASGVLGMAIVLGTTIGRMTVDAIVGINVLVQIRVGCQEYPQHHLDHGTNIACVWGFGAIVVFLSALRILKNLIANIHHQGGNNNDRFPPSDICYIAFVNVFFATRFASIAVTVAIMGVPLGMDHVSRVLFWVCVVYGCCKREEKRCGESKGEDEDNVNTGILVAAVVV